MFELQLSTERLKRLVMIACSVVLSATLAACGSGYDPPAYVPPPVTQPPVVTPSPHLQFISLVTSTTVTANADMVEPDAVDPAAAPTTDTDEPVTLP